jgi:hypothetical protein
MFDAEDRDFAGRFIDRVIDQVAISARGQLPNAYRLLTPAEVREPGQISRL